MALVYRAHFALIRSPRYTRAIPSSSTSFFFVNKSGSAMEVNYPIQRFTIFNITLRTVFGRLTRESFSGLLFGLRRRCVSLCSIVAKSAVIPTGAITSPSMAVVHPNRSCSGNQNSPVIGIPPSMVNLRKWEKRGSPDLCLHKIANPGKLLLVG